MSTTDSEIALNNIIKNFSGNGMNSFKKIILLAIAGIVLFNTFGIIQAGDRGVKTRLGKIVGIVQPGPYFKIPVLESISTMDVRTRTINYDRNGNEGDAADTSQIFGASKDLQDVKIGVVVNYHTDPDKVTDIFAQYSSVQNYETNVLESIVRKTVKSLSASYTAEELVTKRAEFNDKVTEDLTAQFSEKWAILEAANITNFEFSADFTKAIEAKVTATQNAEAARNKLEQVKFEAQQQIESAKAQAEAIRIQAQAINSQGGADYVNLKAVEKWDGKLPTQMIPGSTVPFLQL
ncbi:MAG: prohibitin family protein [Minisyncoccia bacterium]